MSIKQFVPGERNRHGCRASEIQSRRRASGTRLPGPGGLGRESHPFHRRGRSRQSARLIAFPETTGYPVTPGGSGSARAAWAIMRGFVSRYFDNSLSYRQSGGRIGWARRRQAEQDIRRARALGARRQRQPLYRAMDHRPGRRNRRQAPQAQSRPMPNARCLRRRATASPCRCTIFEVRRLGALCCWEHLQPLSKYACMRRTSRCTSRRGRAFRSTIRSRMRIGAEVNNAAIYAVEGSCFVADPRRARRFRRR